MLESDRDGFIGLFKTRKDAESRIIFDYNCYCNCHKNSNKYSLEKFKQIMNYDIREEEVFG